MSLLTAIILGVLQGVTEFLPISSSGHLILAREFFGLVTPHPLAVDAVLQLATILAVALYFRKDLLGIAFSALRMLARKPVEAADRVMVWAIALGTVPVVAAGLLLEDLMETTFRDAALVAVTLILGGAFMLCAERQAKQDKPLTVRKGVGIGLFQMLALVPGVSRSGATISGGLFLGLTREAAARFSFLLAFPAIAGSGLKKLLELGGDAALPAIAVPLALSFATSFVVGLACIHVLLRYLRSHSLRAFAWYRFALAAAVIFTMASRM
jgi:undecaprenyl-diphosphatase